mgnify:CR=1 FL=1
MRSRRNKRRWIQALGAAAVAAAVAGGACRTGLSERGLDRDSIAVALADDDDRRRISYLRSGDEEGRRVIFVHGTPGSAVGWARFLHSPLPGMEFVAIDRPGFGRSGGPPVTSYEAQARAVAALLETRDGKRPILVGHSLGGPIVARTAADHPELVGAVLILAGAVDPDLEGPRWYNHVAAAPIVRSLLPAAYRTSNAEIFAAVEESQALDAVADRVVVPVMAIHGDRDGLVPVANLSYVERRLSEAGGALTLRLSGATHALPWRHEDRVYEAIEDLARLLEQIEERAARLP